MALIHVIIPVYNAEAYLRQTVASVLEQPSGDIDIVLVNDGSTDGSVSICDELAANQSRIHVIHQKNAGVSAARNAGIEHFLAAASEEDYLIFLDSDDVWAPGIFTPELCGEICRDADTDVFVFGSCTSNGDLSRFSHPRRYEDVRQEGGNGCIWKTQGTFCANLYRLSLFRRWGIRFAEGLKYSEDKIFMLQCVFLARYVHFLPQVLHVYRENSSSAMKRFFAIDPIDYYIPIIDGWVASDRFLNGFSAHTGRATNAGVTLASIYFLDMAQEHFERWHRPSRLYAAYRSHPNYELFEHMNPNCVSAKQYADHKLLLEHPLRYRLRSYAVGGIKFFVRMILSFKPIQRLRNERKYPLDHI